VKPDDYDIRCSNACTRAAIAGVLFAALSVAMIQPLRKAEQFDAYLDYVAARLLLRENLGQLESDRAWNALMRSADGNAARTAWNLDKLLAYRFDHSQVGGIPIPPGLLPSQETQTLPIPPALPPRPAPPANLTITIRRKIEPLHRMVESLAALGDGRKLTLARRYSARADRAIYAWASLRDRLLYANMFVIPYGDESPEPTYIGPVSREQITSTLKFSDVIELAEFEAVTLPDAEGLLKERASVTLPSLGVPIGITEGTTIVELGTLLSLFYFWLYYSEARRSPRFPADATLFSVFARTLARRLTFVVFLGVALGLSVILAKASFFVRRENAVIAALTLVAGVLIASMGPLRPNVPDDDFV
jgi:hypothetical protein